MRDLRVTLVQCSTHWHDAAANRADFAARIAALDSPTDLIVLPEMFSTGFTMASESQAEPMDGPTVAWLREQADATDAAVAGSVVIVEDGRHYNRFLAALPGGGLVSYDKRHLFRMAGEHDHYAAGTQRCIFDWRGWRICPQVCYDLRFPVFARNRIAAVDDGAEGGAYDLLLYVANWPARRAAHWKTLLAARAVENQSWVVGVNVVGRDGAGVDYCGDSGVWAPDGAAQAALGDGERTERVTLDRRALDEWREAFPAWKDADAFSLS